jgi:hypothetical protein
MGIVRVVGPYQDYEPQAVVFAPAFRRLDVRRWSESQAGPGSPAEAPRKRVRRRSSSRYIEGAFRLALPRSERPGKNAAASAIFQKKTARDAHR